MFSCKGYCHKLDGSTVFHRKNLARNDTRSGNGTQETRAKVPAM